MFGDWCDASCGSGAGRFLNSVSLTKEVRELCELWN